MTQIDKIVINFLEQTFIFEYFSIGDIGSQLGGLVATAKLAIGFLATFKLFKFIYNLATLI